MRATPRYCECFASGAYCNGCNYANCYNNVEMEKFRQDAIGATLERNPNAFRPKIASSPHGSRDAREDAREAQMLGRHNKGCNCKKSGCLKKYCECFQANILCSENCKCMDCKNFEESEERKALFHGAPNGVAYIHQAANAAINGAVGCSGFVPPLACKKRKIKEVSDMATNYQFVCDVAKSQQAMEFCPREEISNFKELLIEENLYLITEAGEQGQLPVLILSLKGVGEERKPLLFSCIAQTSAKSGFGLCLDSYMDDAYASRGYVAIAIDSRYHGERASNLTTYRDALESAWKNGDTMPFIFDTTWDLVKLADYLTQREDVDPTRIGITGESLGGMHAWFAAFVEPRYAVVAPIIGVQGFRWAIDNDKWQGRVDSIKPVFEEAQKDLGKSAIDKEVVVKVWDRIAPGLASSFDSPHTIPAIAPRPLLILNGAEDPRCPLEGLEVPKAAAIKSYGASADKFKLIAEPGIGHKMTLLMVKEASDWFDKFLKH